MKNRKTMLDYCKLILQAVSFDRKLFRKEYKKALRWLPQADASHLKVWLRQQQVN